MSSFFKCGGCQLQHLMYSEQLKFKTNKVSEALQKIGGLKLENIADCVASKSEYNYRNKVEMPVRMRSGKIEIGFFESGSHNIVPNNYCYLQSERINTCLSIIKEFVLKSPNVCLNSEKALLVKHIVVREIEEKLLITIVATENIDLRKLIKMIEKSFENSYGLYLNINTKNTAEVFGKEFIFINGIKELFTEQNGIKIGVGPYSFFQVNNFIRQRIYSDILSHIENISDKVIIDAYSGAGLLSGILAKNASMVYGVEVVGEAVKNANNLKKRNELNNLINICGKCEEELPKLIAKISKQEKKTVIVLDPPRNGCDKTLIEAVAKSNASQIIYLSCEPSTLARDLKILLAVNPSYKVTSVQPYDMFPQTAHVETLVCLSL